MTVASVKGGVSGWTIDTLAQHVEELREAQEKFNSERDRRYAEVAAERERALDIERAARAEALLLAREIQTYKDEKANELREQINSERGLYASKGDLMAMSDKFAAQLKPVNDFMAIASGRSGGSGDTIKWIALAISAFVGLITIGTFVFITLQAPAGAAQRREVIYVPAPAGTQLPVSPPDPAPQ